MQEVTIRFLEGCVPQDNSGRRYEEGQEETMPYASAMHWIKRRKAVDISERLMSPAANSPAPPSLSDAAEARHEANQRRGRPSKSSSPNNDFATGEDE